MPNKRLKTQKEGILSKDRSPWTRNPKMLKIEGPFAILHGGLSDQLESRKIVLEALNDLGLVTQKFLKNSALEIVLAGAEELEKYPIFNAGFGAKLQRDGIPRLSASVMDGKTQRMAAVSNIVSIVHPSKIAAHLLDQSDRNLCGTEATRYAYSLGAKPYHLETEKRFEEWQTQSENFFGTIGCIAFDSNQNTAACTSTGGRGFETPGRVSDSCSPAGNFSNEFGAVSCTGVGEEILEAAVASSIITRLEDGMDLEDATMKLLSRHHQKRFGFISLDCFGNALVHATAGTIAFSLITKDRVYAGLSQEDWLQIKN
ncbi:MAG: isoaspartyl peptidase/L-asparaginase [Deltaproteobacteria bacterium]|nr:isoaspartyl peptidase/L-asparaginase [Deltaproteobacteria bacterium]